MVIAQDNEITTVAAALSQIRGVSVLSDEPMSAHTSFGIGGPADLFVAASDVAGLQAVRRVLHAREVPTQVVGNGTNLLVRDGGIRGAVVRLGGELSAIREDDGLVIAGGGAALSELCRYCSDRGWDDVGFAAGIPGTVGGAVVMNAGANGGEMAQVVAWVAVVTPAGELVELSTEELAFGYRSSGLQGSDWIIAQVAFRLTPGDCAAIHGKFCETIAERCGKQPVAQRSAGSVFKRPNADYAGRLLQEVGAKGMRVGDAVVSPKHANFIINEGHATARDVLQLVEIVRAKVLERFGVLLETEIVTIGED